MKKIIACLALFSACKSENKPASPVPPPPAEEPAPAKSKKTTAGHIAIKNLEHQISQAGMQMKRAPGDWRRRGHLVELLLMKAQLVGRYDAFDQVVEIAETKDAEGSPDALMVRARVRAALHRFEDAKKDLDATEKLGADAARIEAARLSIEVATGNPEAAIEKREAQAKANPSYGTLTGLAAAYAAAGRFDDAESAYLKALDVLNTTLPFPVAWVHFARGVMWSERAGDQARGRRLYELALEHLPQYAVANVHLAEIESENGERKKAIDRLEAVVKSADDPEPFGLLGELYQAEGRTEDAAKLIGEAKSRYETLLEKHELAFADHAAEFFLGPGSDPARAFALAQKNLDNRENERSLSLAIRAARAAGEDPCPFVKQAKAKKRTGVELEGLLDGCP